MNVAARYAALRSEIPASVTIVGVAKGQPVVRLREAIDAGLGDIGENYVQEARSAFAALPRLRRHFIGHVQRNKARAIAELFDMVQSVDALETGLALAGAAQRLGKQLPVLVQLNISPGERYGCRPEEAERLADRLRSEASLRVEGVMAIGPLGASRGEIEAAFEIAAKTFARIGGSTLSLGMSGDWREALRAGSTMVRIGKDLFGERRPGARKGAIDEDV